jgi:UDP-N-acetylglucosamine diphosphorylase/glucosamine-1-phosphate N-acetyltransferase
VSDVLLVMYDDARAASWQPFTLTRPAGELLLGAFTARARAERIFQATCIGHMAPGLEGFDEHDAPPVIDSTSIPADRTRLFLSSRALPDWSARSVSFTGSGAVCLTDGKGARHFAGWLASPGAPNPSLDDLLHAESCDAAAVSLAGRMLEHVWDLVAFNPAQIIADYDAFRTADTVGAPSSAGDTVTRDRKFDAINYRPGDLRIGDGVTIEPGVVFDFSHGPIWLDDRVTIRAFTRLAGPAYVGHDSTLLGGPYDAVSIGPVCRVHGEVEESIILGYSNKAHDGFLGHAYLGRWVNLGAMTTNSDLKNNYGTVRLWTPSGEADTGTMKMGCLLGDHVKTGIGSLINTGTVISTGANLYGTAMPPKYVPPFSWGSGDDLVAYDVEKFLATAETAMGRRKIALSDGGRVLLRRAWQNAHGDTTARAPKPQGVRA